LQLEGLAQTWWDIEQEKTTFVIEIGDAPYFSTLQPIKNRDRLSEALRNRFYLPRYVQSLWIKWHQLRQLPSQGVQGCIDFFCKIFLLLHVPYMEEVLILKFLAGLLIQFCREVELFENPSLYKTFQRSLAIERKVAPRGRIPQSLSLHQPPLLSTIYIPSLNPLSTSLDSKPHTQYNYKDTLVIIPQNYFTQFI
jgi:hypothetical protein